MTIDVIRLAREAGFKASVGKTDRDGKYHPDVNALSKDVPVEWLERFAALVAAAEREECAKVCDDKAMHCETKAQEAIEAGERDEVSAIRSTAWQISVCAAAIRARKPA